MDLTRRLRIFRHLETHVSPDTSDRPSDAPAQTPRSSGDILETVVTCGAPAVTSRRKTDSNSELMRRLMLFTGCVWTCLLLTGCSAFRPLRGIPVASLPWEERGLSRANMETIDLSRLSQAPLPAHIVDSGDVLAIYVEGALGKVEEVPPVYIPQNNDGQPSLGYPIPVREDGTISLPLIRPLNVRGLTIAQVEDLVRRTYTTDTEILAAGRERIMVSLQKPRTFKVTVLRQETSNSPFVAQSSGGAIQLGQSKKGTGQIVTLPVGENDVLRALTLSGGLPGLDAENAIFVLRRPRHPGAPVFHGTPVSVKPAKSTRQSQIQLTSGRYGSLPPANGQGDAAPWGHSVPQSSSDRAVQLEGATLTAAWGQNSALPVAPGFAPPPGIHSAPLANQSLPVTPAPLSVDGTYVPPELAPYVAGGTRVLRIPIRLLPGEQANFTEADIILYDGDILFIESRETEIFYTDGLLGGGQYVLPRDYDLDVLDAISIAQGKQSQTGGTGIGNRVGGIASSNQDITVSASDLIVIRKMPDGHRVNIKVDLNKALRDPNENLLIQPGDHLVLRYTTCEAIGAFIERNLLAGSIFGLAAQQAFGGGGQ